MKNGGETFLPNSILLIGNFISGNPSYTRQVCEDLADQLQGAGWQVIRTSFRLNRVARLADMIITTWRTRKRYSIVYVEVFSGPSFLWAEAVSWVLRRAGKPYILTLHGGTLPAFAQRYPKRVRYLLRSAAVVTVPSAYMKLQMQPFCPEPRLLPNALDIGKYSFRPRSELSPKLLWLRAFRREINPILLLRAAAQLVDEFPALHISMVGPDRGVLAETQQVATNLGLSERVIFPGRVDKQNVPAWMAQHDIFVNTTNVDNTPISVIEALASGLVVISTNVGGIPFLLEHEHNALLVPPNDPDSLCTAIRRVLTEPDLAERLSRNARAKVEQFDWSVVLPQWECLLSELIDNGIS